MVERVWCTDQTVHIKYIHAEAATPVKATSICSLSAFKHENKFYNRTLIS